MNAAINAGRGAIAPPKDFPPLIQRALARVSGRVGRLAELPPRLRDLLAEFVRCAAVAEPAAPIRIRNATLAVALACSDRTVARLKAELEAAGWIRRQQEITRRHGAQVADVWLLPTALEALGLREATAHCVTTTTTLPSPSPSPPLPAHSGTVSAAPDAARQPSAAHAYEAFKQSPSERQPAGSVENIPEDLAPLQRLGITLAGIRRLMGLARAAGTRLGTVVAAAATSIEASTNPYAYVRRLLALDRDWERVRQTRLSELREEAARASSRPITLPADPALQAQKAEVASLAAALAGNRWLHQTMPLEFTAFAGVVHQAPTGTSAWLALTLDQAARLAQAWRAGRLVAPCPAPGAQRPCLCA